MKKSADYILLLFFAASILGWCWEAAVYICIHSEYSPISILLSYRGVLHGTWVPIYGFGCVMMYLLGIHLKAHPCLFFGACSICCGATEYAVSYALEKLFHARWWDYSNAFLNINGRICAVSVFFFGLLGIAAVYLAEPVFRRAAMRLPEHVRRGLAAILLILFILDAAVSLASPNMGLGVAEVVS